MKALSLHLCLMAACVFIANAQDDVVLDPRFDGASDIYAMAFRPVNNGFEAWLTVAADGRDDGRRRLAKVTFKNGAFTVPEILTSPELNHPSSLYDGVPAFHPCDSTLAIIVSDRSAGGTAKRSNDLYLVRQKGENWAAERLPFNTDAWDDTPCFNTKGNTVYFSSDRRKPGSGKADLYMVSRNGASWNEPVMLSTISADAFHETSPFVFGDSLYFTSNQDGDQGVYKVAISPETQLPVGAPVKVTVSGVNAEQADEYHPVITPGGNWFVFSSDRPVSGRRQYRLYYRRRPNSGVPPLTIRVTARTRVRDLEKLRFFGDLDSIFGVSTTVRIRDVVTEQTQTLATNQEGVFTLVTESHQAPTHPMKDQPWKRLIVEAVPTEPRFVSSIDTILIGPMSCGKEIDHTIYLQDTATLEKKCEFTFRTFNVPFFVTTYWCPTTKKYRSYTPCTSLFTNDLDCEQLKQPDYCQTNEVYRYSFDPAKLTRTRRGAENCVAYNEFEKFGDAWAEEVDKNIEHMRDEVKSALADACVRMAVAAGMSVQVTYIGTTDDRSIDPDCKYTGMMFDSVRSLAPHIQVDSAIVPFIATGRSFNRGGYGGRAGGNQLLSDLRSLYFAILFDNLCKESIPLYRELQQRGQLVVRSRGQAIDNRDLPFALKRAAGVEIRIPEYTQRFAGKAPVANRKVIFCKEGMSCSAE